MTAKKSILLLGSGYVAGPCVAQLLENPQNHVTIASRTLANAERLAGGRDRVRAVTCNVSSETELDALVRAHDLVISLIPYTHHAAVIACAIRHGKHVVTTSYVSPAMAALHDDAVKAGVTVLNEIGVDPGVDHLFALQTIERVHAEGGKVRSFVSYCGGLPAPECSNNPLGYKFSWSSRGVLLALRNEARFLRNNDVVTVKGTDALMASAERIETGYPGYAFLGYANRDSTPYSERYAIPEAHTILRGTLRYQGFPEFIRALAALGLLDDAPCAFLAPDSPSPPLTWAQLVAKLTNVAHPEREAALEDGVLAQTGVRLGTAQAAALVRGCRWLGLFSTTAAVPRRGTLLDALCAALEERMQYVEGERDMVFLQHKFDCERANGSREVITSTGVWYGDGRLGGTSAMARTVGVPCALAVDLVLSGRISRRGVIAPVTRDVWEPLISALEPVGITMVEAVL